MAIPVSHRFNPVLESLENRLLLDGTAPAFTTDLANSYVQSTQGPLTVAVDAQDLDGDAVTVTAASSDPGLVAVVRQGDPYAVLHFTQADGTPVGDIVIQLYADSYPAAVNQFIMWSGQFHPVEYNPSCSDNPRISVRHTGKKCNIVFLDAHVDGYAAPPMPVFYSATAGNPWLTKDTDIPSGL